ncbi:MAG: acetate--CoA ligase family protein [Candidatus Thermoplasmatota archaeon]|nr:acetate--CoA ligase family protein [Candidatus Thermoplasmatota archaeon]
MLDPLFNPKSVAVIGASNKELTIGNRILKNLIDFKFKGELFPVHPKEELVRGLKAYKSILDIPQEVDLAHIVVKNTIVPSIVEECGKKGVKVVIINSAGFKEIGGEGIELERKIVEIGKKYGVRIFGPNCQGIMNTDKDVSVYANFTFTKIKPGNISILAQSGGVGEVINNRFSELGIGIRMYASNGNACDISLQEILKYWGKDEQTRVIVLHIESLNNPKEFMEIAADIARRKPILAMKSGRTEEGAKAITSHTGALVGKDTTTELIFDKCGIVSFRSIEELCDAAIAFVTQPLPKGPKVGVVTNTGGPGIIAADECIDAGLILPDLLEETKQALKTALLPSSAISNPIDVLATGGAKEYGAAIDALLQDSNIDAIMVNFITPFFVDCEGVARELERISKSATKPIICILMTDKKEWSKTIELIKAANIPVYDFPEQGARVLAAMSKYSMYRKRKEEKPKLFEVRKEDAEALIKKARNEKRDFLSSKDAFELLLCYGIPVAKSTSAKNVDEIVSAAATIGYPLALKVESKEVIHKTEVGGVILNITSEAELIEKFKNLERKFGIAEYIAQEFLTGGKELIIGAKAINNLGHVLMFGLGGIYVEIFKDVVFRLAPVTESVAEDMITSIKSYPLLKGVRGEVGVDLKELSDILLKVSQLVTDLPMIKELDINPVIVYEKGKGSKVVDAKVRI